MAPDHPRTVLCIDDNETLLRMLRTVLSSVGHRVLGVTSPREGVQLALQDVVDAVVLDYEMPELNGAEVAAVLKQGRATLPIVMHSAHPPQILGAAVRYIDAFVPKGSVGMLIAELERVLKPASHVPAPRRFPRYPLYVPLAAYMDDRGGEFQLVHGIALDLAEGGMGGMLERELPKGEVVSLNLQLPECGTIEHLNAQVRYRNGASHGFQFVDLSNPVQEELRRCCQWLASS
jgi:CheY-like chemotaxis protein